MLSPTSRKVVVTVKEPDGEIREISIEIETKKRITWTLDGYGGMLMLYGLLLDDRQAWYPPNQILKVVLE